MRIGLNVSKISWVKKGFSHLFQSANKSVFKAATSTQS